MTFLEILGYARKGVVADRKELEGQMQQAQAAGCDSGVLYCQGRMKQLDADAAALDEFESLHNRKS